ncbi:MAG TPA: C-type lectin domain-containing protein [Polyangiaceae bacterium]
MGRRHGRGAFDFGVALAVPCAAAVCVALACARTLEPSIVVGDGDAAGGDSGDPLATCSLFGAGASEYVICPEPLDFSAATADCARRGAVLVGMGSAEENELVATSAVGVVSGNLWLGGSRDDEYVWRWPDDTVFWRGGRDGAPENAAFVLWQPGEPNDSSTVTADPERCLALTLGGNDWNDRACSIGLPYVCERSVVGP